MTKPRGQYGFRLDPDLAKTLEAEAAKRGLTAGRYARLLVIDALTGSDDEGAVHEELAALRERVEALNENLATATVALITTVSEVPEAEVRKWADENLS